MLAHYTIALVRDDRKVLLLQKQQPVKPSINLYTSSGDTMGTIQVNGNITFMPVVYRISFCVSHSLAFSFFYYIQWDKGRIVGMGWTETEQLLCVLEDGTVRMYNIQGEYTQFSLGKVSMSFYVHITYSLLAYEWLYLLPWIFKYLYLLCGLWISIGYQRKSSNRSSDMGHRISSTNRELSADCRHKLRRAKASILGGHWHQ